MLRLTPASYSLKYYNFRAEASNPIGAVIRIITQKKK